MRNVCHSTHKIVEHAILVPVKTLGFVDVEHEERSRDLTNEGSNVSTDNVDQLLPVND